MPKALPNTAGIATCPPPEDRPLPDCICRALTTCVDGELSPRQRTLVAWLVRRYAPAKEMLRNLQRDARLLRHLARRKPGQFTFLGKETDVPDHPELLFERGG